MNISGCKLVVSVVVLSSLNCGYCRLHGVIVGFHANIPCDDMNFAASDLNSPPFWIINGTVYELFSIPRHFSFIPMVTGFSSLSIPLVSSVLHNTTFQCARFGENGMENGTVTQLQVHGGNDTNNIISRNNIIIAELVLNYQKLYTALHNSKTVVSWVLNDTCSERFQVQGYTLDTGEPVLSPEHVFDVGNSTSEVLPAVSNISYKLVAFGENASLCLSNRDIYYNIGGFSTESRLFNSTQCFNIPQTVMCPTRGLNFVWPARVEGRSCVCPVHNSSAGHRVFESCVEGCRDAVLTPTLTEEGHVCTYNLTSSLNGSLFHFVCSTEECGGVNLCFLQTIISSFIASDLEASPRNTSSSTTAPTAPNRTKPESTTDNSSFNIIAAMTAFLLIFLLLLLVVFLMTCYYYQYRRKRCGTITLTTKSGGIKRVAYNTNYAATSPQVTQDTATENCDNFTEHPDSLYDVIPGEKSSLEHTPSSEPQWTRMTTGSENLPPLPQRKHDKDYTGERRNVPEHTLSAQPQQIQTRTGIDNHPRLPHGDHDGIYDVNLGDFLEHTPSAETQQAQLVTRTENPPQTNHDGVYDARYDAIPSERKCPHEQSPAEPQQTRTTTGTEIPPLLPQRIFEVYDITPGEGRCSFERTAEPQNTLRITENENPPSLPHSSHDGLYDVIPGETKCSFDHKAQESGCLENNVSSSQNEAGDCDLINEPTYSTLEDEQKVSEHLYSVVNKAAKKKHRLVVESDEENETENDKQ